MLPQLMRMNEASSGGDLTKELERNMFQITNKRANVDQNQVDREKRTNEEKYRFPATIQGALKHKRAVKFGYVPPKHRDNICGCCGFQTESEDVSICYETSFIQNLEVDEDYKLPSCLALYFTFLKMIIVYLLLRFIITDAYNIVSSYTGGSYCQQHPTCQNSIYTLTSAMNKKNSPDLLLVLDILNLISVVLSIPFFIAYRKIQYFIYDFVDDQLQTQDDYTIFVEDIPVMAVGEKANKQRIELYYLEDLKKIFTEKIQQWTKDRQNFKNSPDGSLEKDFAEAVKNQFNPEIIKSISLCFDLHQFQKIRVAKQSIMVRHQNQNKKPMFDAMIGPDNQPQQDLVIYSSIPGVEKDDLLSNVEQITLLNGSERALSKKFTVDNSFIFNVTHFVGKAFVSFQYQHYRDYFLRESKRDSTFVTYNMEQLRLSKASHPNDIFWEHLNIPDSDRGKRVTQSYVILFMTILFILGILLGTDILQTHVIFPKKEGTQKVQAENKGFFGFITNFLITTIISLFIMQLNGLLYYAIVSLNNSEKHKTRTDHYSSFMVKLILSQFVNSAMNWFIIALIYPSDILSGTGLAIKIANFIAVSGLTSIPVNAISTPWLFKKLGLWFWYVGLKKRNTVNKFQLWLNQEYEYFEFDLAERYSYYIVQMYTSFFYSYIAPICVPALAIIFFFQFWIDKYNLTKRSSFKYTFEFTLSKTSLKMFELSIIIFSLGNLTFSYYANDEIKIINLVALGISLAYVIIIFFIGQQKFRWMFGIYQTCETYTFDSCVKEGKFINTYWQKNPASKFVKEEDITGFRSNNRNIKNIIDVFNPPARP